MREEVERAGLNPQAIVLEPIARNTAPAIAVAALHRTARTTPNAILAVMPSDHVIKDETGFAEDVKRAAEVAAPASSSFSASSRPNRIPATAISSTARR